MSPMPFSLYDPTEILKFFFLLVNFCLLNTVPYVKFNKVFFGG